MVVGKKKRGLYKKKKKNCEGCEEQSGMEIKKWKKTERQRG